MKPRPRPPRHPQPGALNPIAEPLFCDGAIHNVLAAQAGPLARVDAGGDCLNVRPEPDPAAVALACVATNVLLRETGTPVHAAGRDWLPVVTTDGTAGWVAREFVESGSAAAAASFEGRALYGCAPDPSAGQRLVQRSLEPFCIKWEDDSPDEAGWRVRVKYGRGGEEFVHDVPANVSAFTFPEPEWPHLDQPDFCNRRKDFEVEILRLRTDGQVDGWDGFGAIIECRIGP